MTTVFSRKPFTVARKRRTAYTITVDATLNFNFYSPFTNLHIDAHDLKPLNSRCTRYGVCGSDFDRSFRPLIGPLLQIGLMEPRLGASRQDQYLPRVIPLS